MIVALAVLAGANYACGVYLLLQRTLTIIIRAGPARSWRQRAAAGGRRSIGRCTVRCPSWWAG
ncbi:MAG: hypothetical protein R2749_21030 [Acidimicrobiales bacterium]